MVAYHSFHLFLNGAVVEPYFGKAPGLPGECRFKPGSIAKWIA